MRPRGPGEIPNGPLRKAVLAEVDSCRETWSSLCRHLGWTDTRGKPETSRLKRALGVTPWSSHGYVRMSTRVTYETALAIVRALAGVAQRLHGTSGEGRMRPWRPEATSRFFDAAGITSAGLASAVGGRAIRSAPRALSTGGGSGLGRRDWRRRYPRLVRLHTGQDSEQPRGRKAPGLFLFLSSVLAVLLLLPAAARATPTYRCLKVTGVETVQAAALTAEANRRELHGLVGALSRYPTLAVTLRRSSHPLSAAACLEAEGVAWVAIWLARSGEPLPESTTPEGTLSGGPNLTVGRLHYECAREPFGRLTEEWRCFSRNLAVWFHEQFTQHPVSFPAVLTAECRADYLAHRSGPAYCQA